MTPEGKVKQIIKNILKEYDAFNFMPVQNGMGRVGIPDLIACVPVKVTQDMVGKTLGAFVAIETKAPGKIKNTTPNQKAVLREIADARGVAVVTDGESIAESVLDALTTRGDVVHYVP